MYQWFIVAVLLMTSFGAAAQQDAPQPKLSDAPLTSDQIAVYRAVLAVYLKGSSRSLNLADVTEPFDLSDATCFHGLDTATAKKSALVIHRIDPSLAADAKIVLVDPDHQHKSIKKNDPQNLLDKEVAGHQQITDKELDQSVNSAFDSGLFTLSEIVFDKDHRRAVVSYSFVCGGLCGNGNTLLLKRVGQIWRVEKRCGGWVS